MKLLMHILKNNPRLNIDNETLSFSEIKDKLKEEFYELVKAINIYCNDRTLINLKEVVSETFDVIQIAILILWRCHRIAEDLDEPNLIKDVNLEHKDKLISERGWIAETGIEIDIKE